jgi:hypothetical protein
MSMTICAEIVVVGEKSRSFGRRRAPPMTICTAMVSPAARANPKKIATSNPRHANGTETRKAVC